MARKWIGFAVGTLVALSAAAAQAQEGGAASASLSASTSEGVSASSTGERIEENYLEVGIFLGALFPSKDHNLEDMDTENGLKDHLAFKSVAPDVGLRLGYYPVRFTGLELEGALMPTKAENDEKATLWAVRGQLVGQYPMASFTPFAVAGFGRLGVSSDAEKAMGKDSDPAFHFGIGAKVPVTDSLSVRLDLRDTLTQKDDGGDGAQTHHPEVLASISQRFGFGKKAAPPPADTDKDGFLDPKDACPTEPGVAPDGCPDKDPDKDGVLDPNDKCPTVIGIPPDGCPDKDPDKDGILDPEDKCPDVPGVAPDGCPDKDPDKDGILDPDDKCPKEPETKNGYADDDGCPDEVPDEVKKFTGVIEGIEFDTGKATIRKKSEKTLDAAVKVLTDYPSVRLEISGHTDNKGKREMNLELSQKRADSVKAYFVSKGIDEKRITTRGAGPDEPIADNKTDKGRQKNRRTEFKLLQ